MGLRLTSRHCLVFLLIAISFQALGDESQTKIEDIGSLTSHPAGRTPFASQCLSKPLVQCIVYKLRDASARSGMSPSLS